MTTWLHFCRVSVTVTRHTQHLLWYSLRFQHIRIVIAGYIVWFHVSHQYNPTHRGGFIDVHPNIRQFHFVRFGQTIRRRPTYQQTTVRFDNVPPQHNETIQRTLETLRTHTVVRCTGFKRRSLVIGQGTKRPGFYRFRSTGVVFNTDVLLFFGIVRVVIEHVVALQNQIIIEHVAVIGAPHVVRLPSTSPSPCHQTSCAFKHVFHRLAADGRGIKLHGTSVGVRIAVEGNPSLKRHDRNPGRLVQRH